MTALDERAAIGALFINAWQLGSATPIALPNREFTKPRPTEPWVRLSYSLSDSFPLEIGKGKNTQIRHPGMVFVQVFTPTDTGDDTGLTLADEVAAIFRNATVSAGVNGRILFRDPTIQSIGVTGDGWFQINVMIPFLRDECF